MPNSGNSADPTNNPDNTTAPGRRYEGTGYPGSDREARRDRN